MLLSPEHLGGLSPSTSVVSAEALAELKDIPLQGRSRARSGEQKTMNMLTPKPVKETGGDTNEKWQKIHSQNSNSSLKLLTELECKT